MLIKLEGNDVYLESKAGKALKIPAQQPRERKLSDDELRALWAMPEPYGRLLRFALLTGGRIGEAMQFEPEQLVGDLWTIAMTKNGRPHTVPLCPAAAALAKEGWPKRTYEALWSHLVARGIQWRPHDLRRTAATRCPRAKVMCWWRIQMAPEPSISQITAPIGTVSPFCFTIFNTPA